MKYLMLLLVLTIAIVPEVACAVDHNAMPALNMDIQRRIKTFAEFQ